MTEELQAHFEEHQDILRRAVNRTGFRSTMPKGGQEAIDAGLVEESDPTWMYSDDHRTSNGFALTELGRQVTRSPGLDMHLRRTPGSGPDPKRPRDPRHQRHVRQLPEQPQAVRARRARRAGVLPDVPEEPGKPPRATTEPTVPARVFPPGPSR